VAREFKVKRNDPCPCGSGKKYKRCCGSVSNTSRRTAEQMDPFKLSRAIAYKGKIGRQREAWCVEYIKRKKTQNEELMSKLGDNAESKGETITCHIGCSFCCVEQISAPLQECEAIVYYLYRHETVLKVFLQQFPQWHSKVYKHRAIMERLSQLFNEMIQSRSEEIKQAYEKEGAAYAHLDIPCPFLDDNKCLIYEVRPYVCAQLVAATPAEWCNPTSPNFNKRKLTLANLSTADFELTFFYKISHPIRATLMPYMVYGILRSGYSYLSDVTGSDSLKAEAMNDPEVRAITQKLS
jgi:Fe-S-cluster containining protein